MTPPLASRPRSRRRGRSSAETWDKVQAQLAANAGRKRGRTSSKHPSLLAGLLFTAEGSPFTPSHAVNHGRRYRYYVERSLLKPKAAKEDAVRRRVSGNGSGFQAKGWRLPAHQIEQLVVKQVVDFLRDRAALLDDLRFKRKSPNQVSALLTRASRLADTCEAASFAEQSEIVAALVRRVSVAQDKVTIEIDRQALAARLLDQEAVSKFGTKSHGATTIDVPVRFRRRGVEAKLIVLGPPGSHAELDENLVKLLTRAHDWFDRIARGEPSGPGDIAKAEGLCRTYVTRVVCLAFLAPEITKAILEGRHSTELTAKRLIRLALQVPLLWSNQRLLRGSFRP
jgi:site-specific DNA recombinase